jgi:cytochrome c-type biogenesis protein CcmH/NrfG
MAKKEIPSNDYVKTSTLFGAVALALVIGFIAGAVFTSFKLASNAPAQQQANMGTQNNNQQQDISAEMGSKILQLEQYLKTNPNDADAWTQLVNAFFDSEQPKNAIEAYLKSLSSKPNNINVVTDLGVMYRRNDQPQKAIEYFDKAIALDNTFETARFNKGIVLLHDLNDAAGGIKVWEDLVKVSPLALTSNGESVDSLVQRMKKQQQ